MDFLMSLSKLLWTDFLVLVVFATVSFWEFVKASWRAPCGVSGASELSIISSFLSSDPSKKSVSTSSILKILSSAPLLTGLNFAWFVCDFVSLLSLRQLSHFSYILYRGLDCRRINGWPSMLIGSSYVWLRKNSHSFYISVGH